MTRGHQIAVGLIIGAALPMTLAPQVGGVPPAPGSLLDPSHIHYLGVIRAPLTFDTSGNFGNIAGRMVNGHPHVFIWGRAPTPGWPGMIEADLTGLTPSLNYQTAPRISSYVRCGDIMGTPTRRLSWDPQGKDQAIDDRGSIATIQIDTIFNPATGLLYSTYAIQYTPPNDFTLLATKFGTDCSQATALGPWTIQTTNQYHEVVYGWRGHLLSINPLTGKMSVGGANSKGGNGATPWGPSMFTGAAWPTETTPSGRLSPPIVMTSELLNYYNSAGSFASRLDLRVAHPPLYSMQWDMAQMGLYYNPEPGAMLDPTKVDPAKNGGIASWGDYDYTRSEFWFNGRNRQGVLAFLSMAVSPINTTDCSGSHERYANAGNGEFKLSNIAHTPTRFNSHDTFIGLTSGMTGTVMADAFIDSDHILGWQGGNCGSSCVWINGETIRDQVTNETAVIVSQQRYDTCNHGCSANYEATGPSATTILPILAIFDPADLAGVAAGQPDYKVRPKYMINLKALGVKTCQAPQNCTGTFASGDIGGTFFDPSTNNLYVGARGADDNYSELVHVFHFDDSAAPAPVALPTTRTRVGGWL